MKPNVEETISLICDQYNKGYLNIPLTAKDAHDLAMSHHRLQMELCNIKIMIDEQARTGRLATERIEKVLP